MLYRQSTIFYFFLSFGFLTTTDAANILGIFPGIGKSHFWVGEGIMKALLEAGHNVTFITPYSMDICTKNCTAVHLQYDFDVNNLLVPLHMFRDPTLLQHIKFIIENGGKFCEHVLQSQEVQRLVNSDAKIYDVIIIEDVIVAECYLPLAEKLDVPIIATIPWRSLKMADANIGNSVNPAVVPFEFGLYGDGMTFFQRLRNTWFYLSYEFAYYLWAKPILNRIYRRYYATQWLYKKNFSLLFRNSHPSIFPRPLVPNAVDIGGIHIKPTAPLPQDLQTFMDDSQHGVVLFSFGSLINSSTLTPGILQAFREAFARIPQNVIWKFDGKIEDIWDNVLVRNWIPQRDILAHKNMKTFISHCGVAGLYEAIHEGVPMLLAPLASDQLSNAAYVEKLGAGIYLDVFAMTAEDIVRCLDSVINDTRYRDNMRKLSRTFRDRPMTPQQSVVYWTEYVIRHKGAPHLRTAGTDMPFYQYVMLDVLVFVAVVAVLGVLVVSYIMKKVFAFFCKFLSRQGLIGNEKKTT